MNNPSVHSQNFSKSYYFENNKVRRSDMQSSTDLCVTVQLYSLCLLLARLVYVWRQKQDNKTTRQDNLVELEASLAPAEADVGAEAKADQQNNKTRQNSVELEASLAPAEAEVGAMAKADQK